MATDEERLVVSLEARVNQFEKAFQRANRSANTNFSRIESRAKLSTRRLESTFARLNTGMGGVFKNFGAGLLGGIAANMSADKMKSLLDASTRITNALKNAGLSGTELNEVYRKLYESSQRNAAPLESLVTLYSRVASSQKELGVSTAEVLTLTDNVAKAVRLTGGDAQQAAGALLQLSQALGGGKIQAEEYNSMIDGLRPLLQAAAAGMKQAGGSVAKLTQLVKSGAVSSRAFFDAINAGAPTLDQKLGNATLTVSQGMTQVYNSLLDASKEFNEATTTSQQLGGALGDLATAIDNFSVDNAVNQFAAYINGANDAIAATNNFARALGQKMGLDKIGTWFAGTSVGKALGAYTLDSPEGRMQGPAPVVPPYLRAWINKTYSDKSAPATPPKINPVDITRPEYKPLPTSTGGGSRGRSAGGRRAEHNAAQDLIADLERERSLIGATDLEREKANALRRAGANATEVEKTKIGDLVTQIHDEKEAREQQQQAMQRVADAERQFIGGLASDLMHGVEPAEALRNALARLADTLLDQVLNALFQVKQAGGGGGGFLGNIFSGLGSIFGGGGGVDPWAGLRLAGGGGVSGPGSSTSDSIPAMLSDGEYVVNAAATRRNRALLDAINSGRVSHFAKGGPVDGLASHATKAGSGENSFVSAPTININMNGATGGPEDQEQAQNVAKQVHLAVRAEIANFAREQTRNGGMLRR
jgi:tape measure domain-containing protein